MNSNDLAWLNKVKKKIREFSNEFDTVYSRTDRALSAYFEIGCFLALVQFYEENGFSGVPQNLDADNSFRYLTTPNGNPENFWFIRLMSTSEYVGDRVEV